MKIDLPFEIGDRVWVVCESAYDPGFYMCEPMYVHVVRSDANNPLQILTGEKKNAARNVSVEPDDIFPTREEAQAKCDELNKEQTK